jgi:hypothetical protein
MSISYNAMFGLVPYFQEFHGPSIQGTIVTGKIASPRN